MFAALCTWWIFNASFVGYSIFDTDILRISSNRNYYVICSACVWWSWFYTIVNRYKEYRLSLFSNYQIAINLCFLYKKFKLKTWPVKQREREFSTNLPMTSSNHEFKRKHLLPIIHRETRESVKVKPQEITERTRVFNARQTERTRAIL